MVQLKQDYRSDLRQLAPMRAFVRAACKEAWGNDPGDVLTRLELALSEAVANIILHAYQEQPDRSIEVSVDADDQQVCVTFHYEGTPFDPGSAAAPVFDGTKESGFGVYLIRKCVDEVQYGEDESGRCFVRLVQKRKTCLQGENDGADG